MSLHHWGDLIYWAFFFLGECLWVLVCAAAAIRSKSNPLKTRREYLARNWDIYLIRFAVEIAFYAIWRHVALNTVAAFVHFPYQIPPEMGGAGAGGPLAAFFLGFGADSLIGLASHWNRLPEQLRSWIQERIPDVPPTAAAGPDAPTSGPGPVTARGGKLSGD